MKKIKKIIVYIMLVFVLGTGMNITSTFNTVDVRAASVKLNKTNVNLVKGQTLQLKLQGTTKKARWYVSNTSVAVVSKNGKITAKNKGTAVVTAQIGTKKYTCRVTVKVNSTSAKPRLDVVMSSKTDMSAGTAAMLVENKGSKTVRIYSSNARLIDANYKSYNRNLYLVDPDEINHNRLVRISSIEIKPGETKFIPFCVNGSQTWYDRKSTIMYRVKYANQFYTVTSSSYYGTSYYKD